MGVKVSAGKSFTPAPAGVHQAVCCDVVDLGLVEVEWQGQKNTKPMVRLVWQIAESEPETGKPYLIAKRYGASLHKKATLRKDLQSWRGRPFTEAELKEFDLDNVIGAGALLNVVHNVKDGTTYANIEAIMPLPKGTPRLDVRDYVRVQDREPSHAEPETDDSVPF